MHEYRRFIQTQLDERGWKPADLVNRSGLTPQTLSKILNDKRDHLGRMPHASTIAEISRGFGISEESVRAAAARSLVDYSDDGTALTITLSDVSTDALLNEIRRRIDDQPATEPSADTADPSSPARASRTEGEKTRTHATDVDAGSDPEGQAADDARPNVWRDKPTDLNELRSKRRRGPSASAHWPDGVDVDASGTQEEFEAWQADGSPEGWRMYRERWSADLSTAAHDRGPDDEGESERARRLQDEASEDGQGGDE